MHMLQEASFHILEDRDLLCLEPKPAKHLLKPDVLYLMLDLVPVQVAQGAIPDIIQRHRKMADPFAVDAVQAGFVLDKIGQLGIDVDGVQRGNILPQLISAKHRFKFRRRPKGRDKALLYVKHALQPLIHLRDEALPVKVLRVDLLRQVLARDIGKTQRPVRPFAGNHLYAVVVIPQALAVFADALQMRPCRAFPGALANKQAAFILADFSRDAKIGAARGVVLGIQHPARLLTHCRSPPPQKTRKEFANISNLPSRISSFMAFASSKKSKRSLS